MFQITDFITDPQTDGARVQRTLAAICVRGFDDQSVMQFTLCNAVRCALHRSDFRVIHRQELCNCGGTRPPFLFGDGNQVEIAAE